MKTTFSSLLLLFTEAASSNHECAVKNQGGGLRKDEGITGLDEFIGRVAIRLDAVKKDKESNDEPGQLKFKHQNDVAPFKANGLGKKAVGAATAAAIGVFCSVLVLV